MLQLLENSSWVLVDDKPCSHKLSAELHPYLGAHKVNENECQREPQASDCTQFKSVYVSTIFFLCTHIRYGYFQTIKLFIGLQTSSFDIKITLSCPNYRPTDSNPTRKEMYFDCQNDADSVISTIFGVVFGMWSPLTPCCLPWILWLSDDY